MILIVFPHQLFANHPGLELNPGRVLLIEDSLFFGDDRYPLQFHKQKLWLHRASMKRYEAWLKSQGFSVEYFDYRTGPGSLLKVLETAIDRESAADQQLYCVDPTDFILEKRLRAACQRLDLACQLLPNPGFLNRPAANQKYRQGKSRWFMADFYKWQRRRLNLLMEEDEPAGGRWSFDTENRKKVPRQLLSDLPAITSLPRDEVDIDAQAYVNKHYADHPGHLDQLIYPTSFASAQDWLKNFLHERFENFGAYEDAIEEGESWLWHSVLTPALNIGLLTPDEVVEQTMAHAEKHDVPISSLEGFLRQVVGWREFMRATYEDLGVQMRTTNHWQHQRPLPSCFYDATTGIDPIDDTIRRLQATGYCHHIERLMVLGGFMFLCEIDPDDIYGWFMEMFVDSYDWVMVPNVYAMSQNADGGLITTKPYFSGSAYVRKMSHYRTGPWCRIWDGLYWRWIWNHVDLLSKNPRWSMMCSAVKKMDPEKREGHLQVAEEFLARLA